MTPYCQITGKQSRFVAHVFSNFEVADDTALSITKDGNFTDDTALSITKDGNFTHLFPFDDSYFLVTTQ